MRLIVEDALAMVKFHGYPDIEITPSDVNAEAYKRGWNDAIDAIIESAPTVDAVPVVRCKDCMIRYTKRCGMYDCEAEWEWTEDNGFCQYGEREES